MFVNTGSCNQNKGHWGRYFFWSTSTDNSLTNSLSYFKITLNQMVHIIYVLSTWEMHCWWTILNCWIMNDYIFIHGSCTRFITIVWLLHNQPLTNTDKIDWKCWINENRRLIHLGHYTFSITCCSNFVFFLHFLVDHGLAFNFVNINWINGKFLCLFDDNVKKGKTYHSKSTFTPSSTGATPPKSFPGTPAPQHTSQCIRRQRRFIVTP
jgi:hypothetical protein